MRAEKYEGINDVLVIDDNKKKAIISKEENLQNRKKLSEKLQAEGVQTNQARRELITKSLSSKLTLNKNRLKDYFENQHLSKEAEKVDKLDEKQTPQENFQKINDNEQFFGQYFMEGFFEVFGIDLKKSVENYEDNLHIIEQADLDKGTKEYRVGTVQNDDLKMTSDKFSTKTQADEYLNKFFNDKKQSQQKKQEEINLQQSLQRRKSTDEK